MLGRIFLQFVISFSFIIMTLQCSWSQSAQDDSGASENQDNMIVIMDVSNSMWGVFEDKRKIEAARSLLKQGLEEGNENLNIGLIAYGHRQKNSCEDVEIIRTLNKGRNIENDILNLLKLTPKGKSPIGASLKLAGEMIASSASKQGNIILISDGVESCGANICDIAKELKQQNIDLKAHVVGLHLNDAEAEGLACITKETGGRFFNAKNQESLKTALQDADLIKKPMAVPPKKETEIFSEYKADPFANVVLDVRISPESEPQKGKFIWRIFKISETGEEEKLKAFHAASPALRLGEGQYRFEVEISGQILQKKLIVAPRIMYRQSILAPLASLTINAFAKDGSPMENLSLIMQLLDENPTENDANADENNADENQETQPNKNVIFSDVFSGQTHYLVQEGKYQVIAKGEEGELLQIVELKTGQQSQINFRFGYGSAVFLLDGVFNKKLQEGMIEYDIYEGISGDIVGQEPKFGGEYIGNALQLLPGAYSAILSIKNSNLTSKVSFAVSEQVRSKVDVDFRYGTLNVNANFDITQENTQSTAYYMILDLDDNRVALGYENQQQFLLSPGNYELLPLRGANKKRVEFEIIQGEEVLVDIE